MACSTDSICKGQAESSCPSFCRCARRRRNAGKLGHSAIRETRRKRRLRLRHENAWQKELMSWLTPYRANLIRFFRYVKYNRQPLGALSELGSGQITQSQYATIATRQSAEKKFP